MTNSQIYSATYSNVPVFEFVTPEGPIMRRKLDSWINATHILKIAKFPKAKRTRILEKDVQTGTHEKVQGGYGKYQGTYVPLNLGSDIARNFGVFEILRPIFEFKYIEGKSETPPPAPKHNHASALNIAKRQGIIASANSKQSSAATGAASSSTTTAASLRKNKTSPNAGVLPGEPAKKRGRPKRVALNAKPNLKHSDTTPIEPGPNIGTFNTNSKVSFTVTAPISLSRQDTEQDALQIMSSNMNLKHEDLELVESDDDEDDEDDVEDDVERHRRRHHHPNLGRNGSNLLNGGNDNDPLRFDSQVGDDLLGSKELFGTSRDSFERVHHNYNNNNNNNNHPHPHNGNTQNNNNNNNNNNGHHDPYSLSQYHTHTPGISASQPIANGDQIYGEYFSNLLGYLTDDTKIRSTEIPPNILNPPEPFNKININQPIDNEGNTLFHWACSLANIQMIQFLKDTFEISSEIRNNKGETPLMFLVKFVNSYQLKNFPSILQILLESILLVDNSNKTVLHHITSIENDKKHKERFTRYYMETLIDKIIEASDDGESGEETNNNSNNSTNDELPINKKDVISKFINHQDSDGNTAFHIAAYNLNKKCIKVFISYHKYIHFGLRNLVSYTVEDYLGAHNYVLKLDSEDNNGEPDDGLNSLSQMDSESVIGGTISSQSFESQLYYSKLAINLQNSTSNLITEKLTELAYTIDKELSETDQNILSFFKILRVLNEEKILSQKAILSIFKLDYLVDDSRVKEEGDDDDDEEDDDDEDDNKKRHHKHNRQNDNNKKIDNQHEYYIDHKKDQIIQDEIQRLVNDLSYSYLQKKEGFDQLLSRFKTVKERQIFSAIIEEIKDEEKENEQHQGEEEQDLLQAGIQLSEEIIKKKQLIDKIAKLESEFSLNQIDKENLSSTSTSDISNGINDSIVKKYALLISKCSGMNQNDVEKNIDEIEKSLLKSK
ncbi:transcription factor [Scheffersomyces coipomensis]|uniref:transcription factor n=1 Tax=Scheffersomyces coipomensis TaxID=1788519 RepID=UPI00315DA44A